jgi:hypothetical protein
MCYTELCNAFNANIFNFWLPFDKPMNQVGYAIFTTSMMQFNIVHTVYMPTQLDVC